MRIDSNRLVFEKIYISNHGSSAATTQYDVAANSQHLCDHHAQDELPGASVCLAHPGSLENRSLNACLE